MKRPLLLLLMLGYIAIAVYSIGKTGGNRVALKTSVVPATVSLSRVTLVTTNMAAMLRFYNEVFDAQLEPVSQSNIAMAECRQGNLVGISLLLCPNQIIRVKATQNRHQLRFVVTDLEAAIQTIQVAGGKVGNQVTERAGQRLITVRDPDGNAIEFTQANR